MPRTGKEAKAKTKNESIDMSQEQHYSIWRHSWRNQRGEIYVAIQGLLFAWLIFGPKNWAPLGAWPLLSGTAATWTGITLIALGFLIALAAALGLGRALTPLPKPNEAGQLVASGVYRWVRHPIYTGVLLMALGWAFYIEGLVTLWSVLLLAIFFDIKSRREERWLLEKYPEYAAYQKKTRRLIPFIY
jgi:protein-S-isoprenylcysteine O-methyltransferase Ste14